MENQRGKLAYVQVLDGKNDDSRPGSVIPARRRNTALTSCRHVLLDVGGAGG